MNRLIRALTLLAAIAILESLQPTAAFANGYFYGSDGQGGNLVLINTDNGTSSIVGNMPGVSSGVGLAYNPITHKTYTRNSDTLFTVNVSNASTSTIGPSGDTLTGLAFSTDYSTLYSFNHQTGDFYNVDPATGAATLVGNTGIDTPIDMTMSSTGVLWVADIASRIYTVNPTTAAATLVFPPVTIDKFLGSIEFDPDGNLYGVTVVDNRLIRIDTTSGAITVIGAGPLATNDIRGMAFVGAIPEPASMLLMLFGITVLTCNRSSKRRIT